MPLSLTVADLDFFGRDLARPECVATTADGSIYASDKRGGIARVLPGSPA